MYGNLISTAFQTYNWPLGAALSVVLLLGIAASLFVFFLLAKVNRSLLARR